ncbi:uncharacterized protein TNCV_1952171 [Trichonephila clavipes]|nr:uncharacterized protein TNCV_1952171 [Trichonephila clavipes]
MGVRGGGDLLRTASSKTSQICSIMFMFGELGGQERLRNSEECFLTHLVGTVDLWSGALFCSNSPIPSECTRYMNRCRWSEKMSTYR